MLSDNLPMVNYNVLNTSNILYSLPELERTKHGVISMSAKKNVFKCSVFAPPTPQLCQSCVSGSITQIASGVRGNLKQRLEAEQVF